MEKRAGRERAMEENGKESVRNDRKENDLKETTGNNGEEEETRRLIYRGWKVMPFIIGNETFEKLGTIGTLSNLLIYLTTVFNMKSITAATIITVFNGTANLGTLFGAYLCDSYFGRYKTLGFSTVASFLVSGLLAIQLTAAISKLHPPHCAKESSTCIGPTAGQMAFLLAGFILMIVGAGGIRPCNLAFGADQFNPETESGKRGVNSFFNWYFFTYTFAQMISLTLIVYVQSNVSWPIGLGIPAILMLISCLVYYMGTKLYVKVKATGSPMTSVAQVMVVAFKKRKLKPADQPWLSLFNYIPPKSINSKLSYTDQFRFLNKAAIMTDQDQVKPDGSPADPWKLCSFAASGRGEMLAEGDSSLWLIPQLSLSGIAEAFGSIGQVEFYYKQFPENMRSIGGSLFYCGVAASSYLSSLLITVVHQTTNGAATGNWLSEDLNKGRLDYFYYMIAALGVLNMGYFLLCARWYKYKGGNDDALLELYGREKPI
ncbi:hypothetical protein OIU84_001692 [Salix udensis]|uniref:Nitrate transporter n=1 Tax=Salix udensis TaxID=889485 RepID=A0AAD6K7Q9_9ROSI|nr:hypothetical protein OIU84_001692 [Salix udensis]